jgi:predicted Rossmann-fold nucleotide-binding protein
MIPGGVRRAQFLNGSSKWEAVHEKSLRIVWGSEPTGHKRLRTKAETIGRTFGEQLALTDSGSRPQD